jgi:CubicO group peptidase (beta-lactamase class C family)
MIALGGDIVYRRAAGFADRERRLLMRDDTIFRLASLTKPIVSAAALAMIAGGQLALDEPITTWIPWFRPILSSGGQPDITVRHLLTHTSGLDYGFNALRGAFREHGVSNGLDCPGLAMDEQLRRLMQVPLQFSPGTAWNYSLSTDVLGDVIARAGGIGLPAAIDRYVTGPLKMTDTAFRVGDVGRLATPYADAMPRPVPLADPQDVPNHDGLIRFSPSRIFNPDSFPSAGAGMAGTASDFLCFLETLRRGGPPILDHVHAEMIGTDQLPEDVTYPDPGWRFGMGAAVLCDPAPSRTPHYLGTWRWGGGYGHSWFVNPRRALTVVSLTNTAFEGVDGAYPINLCDAIYYALTS